MPVVQIGISYDLETNGIQVQGPLQNPLLMMGILALAHTQYVSQLLKSQDQLIQPATGVVIPKMPGQ